MPPKDLSLGTVSFADELSTGAVSRFNTNLDAIRISKDLVESGRDPTAAEQLTLAKYSGFGDSAFGPAFERFNKDEGWQRRRAALQEVVGEDEFRSIERSRLNAFFTTPEIIDTMWKGIERFGGDTLTHPTVLEPSAGAGRFLGLQPADMAARSKRIAVELDDVTGNIVKHAYPETQVFVMGYQDAPIANDSVDIAISNVPFGNFPVNDPEFKKGRKLLTRQIHNYFFAKTLDKLRPGGMLAFITTHNTLDAPTAEPIRQALADRADLIAAVRLPKTAFPDTEVVTDIIYMRKRLPDEEPGDQRWVGTTRINLDTGEPAEAGESQFNTAPISNYFIDHPTDVLGTHSKTGTMFRGGDYSVEPLDIPLARSLATATARAPENILSNRGDAGVSAAAVVDKSPAFVGLSASDQARADGMVGIRNSAQNVLDLQLAEASDVELQAGQSDLSSLYDTFTSVFGALGQPNNVDLLKGKPDFALLQALERSPDDVANSEQIRALKKAAPPAGSPGAELLAQHAAAQSVFKKATLTSDQANAIKMPIFNQRVIRGFAQSSVSSPIDALTVVLNEKGWPDFDRMGELLGKDADTVRRELGGDGLVYHNPVGDWEVADKYLTGNVKEKLDTARRAATVDRRFNANVQALEGVQPAPIAPSDIGVRLGAPWIPAPIVNEFVQELLQPRFGRGQQYFKYVTETGDWVLDQKIPGNPFKMESEWGTPRISGAAILDRMLNGQAIEVRDKDEDGRSVRNPKETLAAQNKAKAIQEEFETWAFGDTDRADLLAEIYNDRFNNVRPRTFDGSHKTFPGMTLQWSDQLHQQQKDAIWRVLQDRTALLAHEVGFGKTAIMVAAGMELRRLGLASKNVYVLPKHTHAQFREQFKDIYPYSKILFPEADDFTPSKRGTFLAKATTGDWDAIILSGDQFARIPVKPETEIKFLRQEVDAIRAALESEQDAAQGRGGKTQTQKELAKALERAEVRIQEQIAASKEKAEDTIKFEDMGIDQLFVDESDLYKNLRFATRMGRLKGLPNSDSKRAFDMFLKVRVIQDRGKGNGVVFATGTPIANTVAELYTNMRYLQSDELEKRDIQHFDAWAKTFGATTEGLEQSPTGAYRLTQRFAKFQNIPELSNIWQSAADIRVTEDSPTIVKLRPRLVDDDGAAKRTVIPIAPDQPLLDFMAELAVRADNLSNVDPTEDNMLKISGDARMASLDMRMVDPRAPSNPEGKLVKVSENVARIYGETNADRGVQLVFLDIGTPKAKDKADEDPNAIDEDSGLADEQAVLRNVYGKLKQQLISAGIPEKDVAFIHDAKTDKARVSLFNKVNTGEVRVLIGSTGKMGSGVNVQQRAAALHHVDAPWRPRDIEQREGRVIRQGNVVYGPTLDAAGNVTDPGKGVRIFTYVTERSFDAFMWQAIEAKAKAIKSIMRRDTSGSRGIEDIDSLVMGASEAKALATGDPRVMRQAVVKNEVSQLQLLAGSNTDAKLRATRELQAIPRRIEAAKALTLDLQRDNQILANNEGPFSIVINGRTFNERTAGSEALAAALVATSADSVQLGTYRGLELFGQRASEGFQVSLSARNSTTKYSTVPQAEGDITPAGLMSRVDNQLANIGPSIETKIQDVAQLEKSLEGFQKQQGRPFEQQERLDELLAELARLDRELAGIEEEEDAEVATSAAEERDTTADTVTAPEPTGVVREPLTGQSREARIEAIVAASGRDGKIDAILKVRAEFPDISLREAKETVDKIITEVEAPPAEEFAAVIEQIQEDRDEPIAVPIVAVTEQERVDLSVPPPGFATDAPPPEQEAAEAEQVAEEPEPLTRREELAAQPRPSDEQIERTARQLLGGFSLPDQTVDAARSLQNVWPQIGLPEALDVIKEQARIRDASREAERLENERISAEASETLRIAAEARQAERDVEFAEDIAEIPERAAAVLAAEVEVTEAEQLFQEGQITDRAKELLATGLFIDSLVQLRREFPDFPANKLREIADEVESELRPSPVSEEAQEELAELDRADERRAAGLRPEQLNFDQAEEQAQEQIATDGIPTPPPDAPEVAFSIGLAVGEEQNVMGSRGSLMESQSIDNVTFELLDEVGAGGGFVRMLDEDNNSVINIRRFANFEQASEAFEEAIEAADVDNRPNVPEIPEQPTSPDDTFEESVPVVAIEETLREMAEEGVRPDLIAEAEVAAFSAGGPVTRDRALTASKRPSGQTERGFKLDKKKAARIVVPAIPRTPQEERLLARHARTPNRLDVQGLDAPPGTPTALPVGKARISGGGEQFKLPGGQTVPAGSFPEEVEWPQGENMVRYNLFTGKQTWTDRKPDGTKPEDGFRVITWTPNRPPRREMPMGLFSVRTTRSGVAFERVKRERDTVFRGRRGRP